MARPKPAFTPEPRMLNQWQVACRLGKSEQWFMDNRIALEQLGFPHRDGAFAGWDSNAIEAWFDKRAGIINASNIEQEMLQATHGESPSALRRPYRRKGADLLSVPEKGPPDHAAQGSNFA